MKPQKDLETYFSYTTKWPIKTKELMTKSIDVSGIVLDPEKTYSDMWWSTSYTGERTNNEKFYMHLKQRIVSFAGEQVSLEFGDEYYNNIFIHGQLWYNDRVNHEIDFDGCPHTITAMFYKRALAKQEFTIATGYALYDDGVWRRHSWLVFRKSRSVCISEPTTKKIAYFGFVLDKDQCEEFYNKFVKED